MTTVHSSVYTVRVSNIVMLPPSCLPEKVQDGDQDAPEGNPVVKARLTEAERHYEANFKAKDAG